VTVRRLALLATLLPALSTAQAPAPAPPVGAEPSDVRTLEERVSDLRGKIYRPRGRLQDLRSKVGGAETGPARARLVHRNEMGGAFRLHSINYSLDDAPLYSRVDLDGDLARAGELEIFEGELAPGEHRLSIELVYRGHGGPARRYVDGHRFAVRAAHVFVVEGAKTTLVRVVGFERGGVTTELKNRPAVRFEASVDRDPALAPPGTSAPRAATGRGQGAAAR
jgi:hypothetical protein